MLDLSEKNRIVIKIGSSLLVKDSQVRKSWLKSLVKDIKALHDQGLQIVIVSSGAIALGKHSLFEESISDLPSKQAAAAIGQIELMGLYQSYFSKNNINVAQILLTNSEAKDKKRYQNASNTFEALLANKIIPIVNENDSVATSEIKIGDNDQLAAMVANMIKADILILFSDIDGLYDKNPHLHDDAKFIDIIKKIDHKIESMASDSVSDKGTGGMVTKIKAAKIAANSGCNTIVAKGIYNHPINRLLKEGRFSIFSL